MREHGSKLTALRVALYVLGIALTLVGAAAAYFCRNSLFTFAPTPLRLHVSISPGWRTETQFRIQHNGVYEIQFDCEDPPDLRPPQYGPWNESLKAVSIRWEVLAGERRIATGSSETYPENSYTSFGGTAPPRSGSEIGRFNGEAEISYTLKVLVESGDETLNAHDPRVNVELNGQELSDISNVDGAREFLYRQARRAMLSGALLLTFGLSLHIFAKARAR